MSLGRAIKRESGARTRSEVDSVDATRASDDLDRVAAHGVAHAHGAHLVAQLRDVRRAQDRLERIRAYVRRAVDAQDRVLVVGVRVAEVEQKKESVELRLGKREGALELHR